MSAAIQASARRALIGLMCGGSFESAKFWAGYAMALIGLRDGTADKLAARDASLSAQQVDAGFTGAWARLTVGIEAITAVEMQQRFGAEGVQVTLDAAAQFQLNAVEHFKHNEVAPVNGDEYVAALAVLLNDGAGAGVHGRSVPGVAS